VSGAVRLGCNEHSALTTLPVEYHEIQMTSTEELRLDLMESRGPVLGGGMTCGQYESMAEWLEEWLEECLDGEAPGSGERINCMLNVFRKVGERYKQIAYGEVAGTG